MFNFFQKFKCDKLKEVIQLFESEKPVQVMGLDAISAGFFLGACKNGVLIAKDLVSSGKIAEMLSSCGFKVKFLTSPFENNFGLVDNNLKDDFFVAINDFVREKIDFLIALPETLFQKVPTKKDLLENSFVLSKGNSINLSTFSQNLIKLGYEKVEFISSRGEFSIKGDTAQIFPVNSENLIRVEFFDTEIERISEISFADKKFVKTLENCEVFARDLPLSNTNILSLSDKVFFDEPKIIEEHINSFEESENFLSKTKLFKNTPKKKLAFSQFIAKTFFIPDEIVRFSISQNKSYVLDFLELVNDLNFFKNGEKEIYLFCGNDENKNRLKTFLDEHFIFTENIKGEETKIHLLSDFLPYSVLFADSDCVFIGTNNLFKKHSVQKEKKTKIFLPKLGQFVVHEKHGIGKCVGLEKLKISGYEKDYIIIEYAGGDKFYLPSEQADSLSAYGASDALPKLNKLGGADFARVKEKVYKSVKEMAFDLLELYAKREKAKGKIYLKDDYLMQSFEDAFPYQETPDQLRAINDIKSDMESSKIMDRLVCGDVGFGKTEVALRAIYKAVLSGSQVAFLCPTTILCEQHYKTCQKRFNGFMVKTARFNRLISKKEESEVLKGLADGSINVVCGTHKLLSKNVQFKNLTLLVLDEEQRFGVEDKEKIKNMKENIDVLTLSATPIPRTLNMSLSGIRDISIIDTPPVSRQPIQTFVTEFDENLILRACKTELARDGQILIIYNRIDTIYDFAGKIKKILPNVRIGVAHGRLSAKLLEESIMKLYSGEYQILISTTLIENGIDLPSANTLIVIDADKLGLAQAYQIRGRIGRGDKMAYAYFLLEAGKKISDNAYKRLSALMENTGFGSGLKIAMADLDIRGAGNVLGKEQSGNLMKVGYDLYYKLLNFAIKDLKGEKEEEKREVKLDINLDAFIPETYIDSEDERLKIITEISEQSTHESAKIYLNNLEKTFGKVPVEVKNLALLAVWKREAEKLGISRIVLNSTAFHIYFYDKKDIILDETLNLKEKIKVLTCFFNDQLGQNS